MTTPDPTATPEPTSADHAAADQPTATTATGDQPATPAATDQTATPPAPSEPTPTPTAAQSASSAGVGDVISYQLDDDEPAVNGLVVGRIDAGEARPEQLLVVPLGDATAIPLDAVKG